MAFRTINDGEKAPRKTDVSETEKVVDVTRVTRRNKNSDKIIMDWTLDFNDVSDNDLLELATRTVVIYFQGKFRDDKTATPEKWDGVRLNVQRDMIDAERKSADPSKSVVRDFAKMTPEKQREMLELLQRQINGDDESTDE